MSSPKRPCTEMPDVEEPPPVKKQHTSSSVAAADDGSATETAAAKKIQAWVCLVLPEMNTRKILAHFLVLNPLLHLNFALDASHEQLAKYLMREDVQRCTGDLVLRVLYLSCCRETHGERTA
eukprot:183472-Rhodomonas_salina.4